jgi:hypothetical protein
MINIGTYLDNDEIFRSDGLNWLRRTKSFLVEKKENCKGFVLGKDLTSQNKEKILELGFVFIDNDGLRNDFRDYANLIVEHFKQDDVCILIDPKIQTIDLNVPYHQKDYDIYNLVAPIVSLENRVKAISELKNKQLYSSQYIHHNYEAWVAFNGFLAMMHDSKFVDYEDTNLSLNLFLCLDTFWSY